jgi:hypothetical protein
MLIVTLTTDEKHMETILIVSYSLMLGSAVLPAAPPVISWAARLAKSGVFCARTRQMLWPRESVRPTKWVGFFFFSRDHEVHVVTPKRDENYTVTDKAKRDMTSPYVYIARCPTREHVRGSPTTGPVSCPSDRRSGKETGANPWRKCHRIWKQDPVSERDPEFMRFRCSISTPDALSFLGTRAWGHSQRSGSNSWPTSSRSC